MLSIGQWSVRLIVDQVTWVRIPLLDPISFPRRSMDRARGYGPRNAGSIPAGGTRGDFVGHLFPRQLVKNFASLDLTTNSLLFGKYIVRSLGMT